MTRAISVPTSLLCDNSTDANFRAWGSQFETLLETGGFWQKTADTGQIDWTTVVSPANGSFAGYEIYKTVDPLSSVWSLYMRIDYGTEGAAPKGPWVRWRFGTQTDGAGNLIGTTYGNSATSNLFNMHNIQNGQGATRGPFYASGSDEGYFGMFMWADLVNSQFSWAVGFERSVNNLGTHTSDYIVLLFAYYDRDLGGNTVVQQLIFNPSLGIISREFNPAVSISISTAQGGWGSRCPIFAVFPYVGYVDNALMVWVGLKTGDITDKAFFDVTLYGTVRHYLWLSRGAAVFGAAPHLNTGIGLRWEVAS